MYVCCNQLRWPLKLSPMYRHILDGDTISVIRTPEQRSRLSYQSRVFQVPKRSDCFFCVGGSEQPSNVGRGRKNGRKKEKKFCLGVYVKVWWGKYFPSSFTYAQSLARRKKTLHCTCGLGKCARRRVRPSLGRSSSENYYYGNCLYFYAQARVQKEQVHVVATLASL